MTDQLKTFECRSRFEIKARSRKDAEAALDVSVIAMTARVDAENEVHIRLTSIEVLGEVGGE